MPLLLLLMEEPQLAGTSPSRVLTPAQLCLSQQQATSRGRTEVSPTAGCTRAQKSRQSEEAKLLCMLQREGCTEKHIPSADAGLSTLKQS